MVVGMRHPLPHCTGRAVAALLSAGVRVYVLGDDGASRSEEEEVGCD